MGKQKCFTSGQGRLNRGRLGPTSGLLARTGTIGHCGQIGVEWCHAAVLRLVGQAERGGFFGAKGRTFD